MSTTAWLAHNWGWVILWVWILGGFSAAAAWGRAVLGWCSDALATHHKRKVALAKTKAKAAKPPVPALAVTEKQPGPCVHRRVTPVIGGDDEVVAWLCKTCDTQLPADWAVRAEDL